MTDEIGLLRRHRHDPPAPGDLVTGSARQELARAIAGATRASRPARLPAREPRTLRMRVAAGAALALVLAFGIVAGLDSGTSTTTRALAAGPVLRRLAQVAATQPSLKPGPGQFLYTATTSLTESDTFGPGGLACHVVYPEYRRDWVAENGEGLTIEQDGHGSFRLASEARTCRDIAAQLEPGARWNWAAPGCMVIDPVPLGRLPLNPARLRARLLTGKVEGGPPGPAEAFVQAADLLRKTDAPAALRAALFSAAAGLRGVRSLGEVSDRQGRRGVALAIDDGAYRSELVFSLTSSDLLEERELLWHTHHGVHAAPGTILSWSTYSIPAVVNALPKPSPLPLTPSCIKGGETGRRVPGHPDEWVNVGFRPKR